MFLISELTAAPHFPQALLPLIAATTNPDIIVSVRVTPPDSRADVEIFECDGQISVAISASIGDN